MSEGITVSPFYYSAVNEITKPNSLVFLSHYFVDRWMRDLGPVGTAIVAVLRSHCYQNRTTHELRNRIQLSVPAIAAEVGVSPKTIRRELVAIHTGSGITPKPKLVEVRAKNLYKVSWKK